MRLLQNLPPVVRVLIAPLQDSFINTFLTARISLLFQTGFGSFLSVKGSGQPHPAMIVCSVFIFVNPVLFLVHASTFPHFFFLIILALYYNDTLPFSGCALFKAFCLQGMEKHAEADEDGVWRGYQDIFKTPGSGKASGSCAISNSWLCFSRLICPLPCPRSSCCSTAPHLLSQWRFCQNGSNPDFKSRTHQLGFIISVNKANFWTSRLEKSNLLDEFFVR